jgi:hypothetical protein
MYRMTHTTCPTQLVYGLVHGLVIVGTRTSDGKDMICKNIFLLLSNRKRCLAQYCL